jgi:hypothetical protein
MILGSDGRPFRGTSGSAQELLASKWLTQKGEALSEWETSNKMRKIV